MKGELRSATNLFWFVCFFSSFFLLFEICIFKAYQGGSLFSTWALLAAIYILLVVESEIYFFNFLCHTKWWQEKVLPHWSRIFKNDKRNDGDWSDHYLAKIIKSFEYLGLVLSTMFINLSKVGAFVFVANRAELPHGRLFLYSGCMLRIPFEYGLWTLVFQIRDGIF